MTSIAVIGLQWGDEGKGKIVDSLTADADAVVRFQGGHNAGHTITTADGSRILHLLPSGILRKRTECLIGNGVVLSPQALIEEIESLAQLGLDVPGRLRLSDACPLLFSCHCATDAAREAACGTAAIGTTGRGIGPAYEDKAARRALRLSDLASPDRFAEKLKALFDYHNFILEHYYRRPVADSRADLDFVMAHRDLLLGMMCSVPQRLRELQAQGANILFEGAQGAMLDLDHGTYPYVTSSNTLAAGIGCGAGFPPRAIDRIVGVVKAYTTRVGNGPFPTELNDETGCRLAELGNEFGATTGRPRRCGWLDMAALRSMIMLNGVGALCLTKLDVFEELETLRICVSYRNRRMHSYTADQCAELEPEYIELPGWRCSLRGIRDYRELPRETRDYVAKIEELGGAPVKLISTSPDREDNIVRSPLF